MNYFCTIRRYNSEWKSQFKLANKTEFELVTELCKDEKNMAGFWKATVMPIRTDREHLSQDLFLPTLTNGIIRTQRASSVVFILLSLAWDVATLPIRLITLIPRAIYNARMKSDPHPLIPFFENKGLTFSSGDFQITLDREYTCGRTIETNQQVYCIEGTCHPLPLSNKDRPFFKSLYAFLIHTSMSPRSMEQN